MEDPIMFLKTTLKLAAAAICLTACVSDEQRARRALDAAAAASKLAEQYMLAVPAVAKECVAMAEGGDFTPANLRALGFVDNSYSFTNGVKMESRVGEMTSFLTFNPRSDGCSIFFLGNVINPQTQRRAVADALTEMGFELGPLRDTGGSEAIQKVLTGVLFGTMLSNTNFQTAVKGDTSLELSHTMAENGYEAVIILTPVPEEEGNEDRG